MSAARPLSGVIRTSSRHRPSAVFDPKRTLTSVQARQELTAHASIQNKLEPASNNNGLHCQSAVAVAIGAKRLSGALSNAADPELVLPMVAAARHRPEQAIQRAVFDHLRQRGAPGTFAFHPPNGGWRSVIEAAILKGRRGGHARRDRPQGRRDLCPPS